MTAFMTACIFVVLAEMGDKTQLLAMAFATKYNWKTVMATEFVPMSTIQLAASISFIIFGLWTIRGDKLEGEDKERGMSPFWTVAVAFFIAEMGDKTQLATVALAAQFNSLIPVWMGTTTGMMIADGFGVVVGNVLGKRIPERAVKWGAATVFILFGLIGIYDWYTGGSLMG